MTQTDEIFKKIEDIFFDYNLGRREEFKKSNKVLSHYTSAANAVKIIQSKMFWMKEAANMNDYSEVLHGIECFFKAFDSEDGVENFKKPLDLIEKNFSVRVGEKFKEMYFKSIENETYFACFSEHDLKEDFDGKLSMWRGYGNGTDGVALIVNPNAFFRERSVLQLTTSPVAYFTDQEFAKRIYKIGKNIEKEIEWLKKFQSDQLLTLICNVLKYAIVSTKNPAFLEEKEWRLIHFPKTAPSALMERSVEVCKDVPQVIYKIPLINNAFGGLDKNEIKDLILQIIVGPSSHQNTIRLAIVEALVKANVQDPEKLVTLSRIPFRK